MKEVIRKCDLCLTKIPPPEIAGWVHGSFWPLRIISNTASCNELHDLSSSNSYQSCEINLELCINCAHKMATGIRDLILNNQAKGTI